MNVIISTPNGNVELTGAAKDAFLASLPGAEPHQYAPLTARQLRLSLVMNGFSLDQVGATINAIEDQQDRALANIEWDYASQFERSHPLIAQVGAALGLTEEQIDAMWVEAAGL